MERHFEIAKKVNYGPDDKPDKYGWSNKMHDIWDLVEEGKALEDGGFEITEADRAWYEDYKEDFEFQKEVNGGVAYHFPRYDPWDG